MHYRFMHMFYTGIPMVFQESNPVACDSYSNPGRSIAMAITICVTHTSSLHIYNLAATLFESVLAREFNCKVVT